MDIGGGMIFSAGIVNFSNNNQKNYQRGNEAVNENNIFQSGRLGGAISVIFGSQVS